jgi:hypothetical protein
VRGSCVAPYWHWSQLELSRTSCNWAIGQVCGAKAVAFLTRRRRSHPQTERRRICGSRRVVARGAGRASSSRTGGASSLDHATLQIPPTSKPSSAGNEKPRIRRLFGRLLGRLSRAPAPQAPERGQLGGGPGTDLLRRAPWICELTPTAIYRPPHREEYARHPAVITVGCRRPLQSHICGAQR